MLFCISKSYFHFCEFRLNPKNVISCFGKNIDLYGWMMNPSEFAVLMLRGLRHIRQMRVQHLSGHQYNLQ